MRNCSALWHCLRAECGNGKKNMAEELRNENSKLKRINLLGVPVDVCNPGDMDEVILEILAKPGTKQIVFLSVWDLLKGRKKKKQMRHFSS